MKKIIFLLAFIFLLTAAVVCAQEMERQSVAVTVYNQNFALIRDMRFLNLAGGMNRVTFTDIAAKIEPPSVFFKSLTDPSGCSILEQNFEYDLVSADKLLLKYVDREISVLVKEKGRYEGYLSSYDAGQIVLAKDRAKGPITMINRGQIHNVEFPSLPEGLITKPTLMWLLDNRKAGRHLMEVVYLTGGMTWQADYVVHISGDERVLGLSGLVTIDNRSGAGYEDAQLKLVAGDVQRVRDGVRRVRDLAMVEQKAAAPSFEEKTFFEYHLYTLQRKTTLKNNQTKQIALLSAAAVPVDKIYTYDGALYGYYYYDHWQGQPSQRKVAVKLEFKNSNKGGLGMPLPKGKIKVYKADTDGSAQFIGEDAIDHTPRDEKVSLSLGNAFDVVGERKITDHTKLGKKAFQDSYEVVIRNHKKEAVSVRVIEHQWGDWAVVRSSHPYTKKDASTLEFNLPVPADGETKLLYTAEYRF